MPYSLDLAGIREALDIDAAVVQSEPHRRGHRLARAPERDEQRKLLADQRLEAVRGPGDAGGCVGPTVEQPVLRAADPMREAKAVHDPVRRSSLSVLR